MISNTEEGKKWLGQFEEKDKETATLLLDSLILVDQAEFEGELEKTLNDFLKKHKGAVALYTAVERPKLSISGNIWGKMADITKPFFPSDIRDQNLKREPENYALPGNTGSEGAMAHFCRDYARKHRRVFSHPGIEVLRQKKVRWLICVDDVVGSGNRMKEFIEWIYADKTIRSWHSFGWMRFVVLSYAASEFGRKILAEMNSISENLQCQHLSEGRTIWTKDEHNAIQLLCKKYAKLKKLGHPLGYKSAFSMIIFSHGCPNTNPSVLWEEKNRWKRLVQGTGRPAGLLKNMGVRDEIHQVRLLIILGQTRLTKPSLFKRLNPSSQKLLLLLACIAKKKRNSYVLSEMLGVPISFIEEWLEKCQSVGWIDEYNILTISGKYTLEAARRNKCIGEYNVFINNDFYFPMSLRSPVSSSSNTPPPGSRGC